MDTWLPIDNGRQQSSYTEFTIKVAPGDFYKLDNPFNYFRCLEANMPFQVAWSTNNGKTNFQAGLGVKFDVVLPYALIFNDSESELSVSVGVGIGYFDDSRLSVSGTLYVANNTETPIYTTDIAYTPQMPQVVTVTTSAEITPTVGVKKAVLQNSGTSNLNLYAANGLILPPLATVDIAVSEPFSVFGNGSVIYQEWI